MPADYTNTVLANRYQLRQRIGQGGMATVYEAIDRELNKPVAVKILNPQYACQPDYLARFRQEAREAARIRHEHLVDVTDQGMSDGIAFFVMEFLRGDTLQGYLHPDEGVCRQVPWRTMVQIVVQVCEALQHAHDHGVIHRDIKPANCFLITRRGGEFFTKVLDLGIAKVTQEFRDPNAPPSTRASQGTPGTPEYMSPEQVMGDNVTAQSDIYALGVMMYRMLTGHLPFFSERSPYETMEQHCKQAPVPPRQRAPEADIHPSVEREVLRALAKRPEERHSSAQELGDTLRDIAEADARRNLLGEDDDVRTQQYRFHTLSTGRSLARVLSYAAAGFSGLTLSIALFMVFTVIPVQAQEPLRTMPTAVTVDTPARPQPAHAAARSQPVAAMPTAVAQPPPVDPPLVDPPPVDPPTVDSPASPEPEPTVEPDPPPSTSARPKPPNPAAKPPAKPPAARVRAFLQRNRAAMARRCDSTKPFPIEELVAINVTLDPPTGRVVRVATEGRHERTALGACVQQAVRNLTFPTFTGALTSFTVTLTL